MHEVWRIAALLAAALLLGSIAACAGDDGGREPTGRLLLGDVRGIIELDLEAGMDHVLVAAPITTVSLRDPALSPDGARIAFTSTAAARLPGGRRETNGDLWIANRDGTDARLLTPHLAPNTGLAMPVWEDDDTLLAVSHSLADANVRLNYPPRLVRVNVATGAATEILAGVRGFGRSPDGTRVATVSTDEQSLSLQSLDGAAGGETIVAAGEFLYIVSPRYSPKGDRIAFVAFDAASYPPPDPAIEPEASLWTVSPTGADLTRVSTFVSDDRSSIAWSGDGGAVYVLGTDALMRVDMASGEIDEIRADISLLTTLAWEPAPPSGQDE